ncbi:MAG: hypothetical protein SGI88_07435 [Candidatus Hydrogenedentes bacterium]|nr:hypothetical protein [Candidatus Hydrogenedentota bacterium]
MSDQKVTRRAFITVAATATAAISLGCPRNNNPTKGVVVFKRSGRGVHVSNAAKKHNANMLYKTSLAASNDNPHEGDNSYVVQLTINRTQFDTLFANGRLAADLRHHL